MRAGSCMNTRNALPRTRWNRFTPQIAARIHGTRRGYTAPYTRRTLAAERDTSTSTSG